MSSNLNWICGWKYGEISRARFELIGNLQDRELYLGQHSQTKCFNYQLHQNLSFCFYCQAPTAIANFQLPSFRLRQGVPSNISAQEVYITSSYYDIESVSLSPFTDVCHARKVFANNVGGTFSVFHRVPLKAHGPRYPFQGPTEGSSDFARVISLGYYFREGSGLLYWCYEGLNIVYVFWNVWPKAFLFCFLL